MPDAKGTGVPSAGATNDDASEDARLRILIVDDDPLVLSLIRITIADEGHEVVAASSGEEALQVARTTPPDVIILDLSMPVMDGRECFRRLREEGVSAPVVILSAYGAQRARRELNAEAAMNKPFDTQALLQCLERLAPR